MAMRPAATPSRMNSGSRPSFSATMAISRVMVPARAASICVIELPSLALPMSGSSGRSVNRRFLSACPARCGCKLPGMKRYATSIAFRAHKRRGRRVDDGFFHGNGGTRRSAHAKAPGALPGTVRGWCPQEDSNLRFRLEEPASLAARRWGRIAKKAGSARGGRPSGMVRSRASRTVRTARHRPRRRTRRSRRRCGRARGTALRTGSAR